MIEGVLLTSPKIIPHPLGDIARAMKASEPGFHGFGEAYFTAVHEKKIKGWKKHQRMVLNLLVVLGAVRFVIYDDREKSPTRGKFCSLILSRKDNYQRLTVPAGLWVAFQGLDAAANLVLNLASLEHDPNESENRDLAEIAYDWNQG